MEMSRFPFRAVRYNCYNINQQMHTFH